MGIYPLIKKRFYFFVASYFCFFAKIRLTAWKPKIILVTGSSGKTTLLHLLEAQIKEHAKYSHHANSSFGIPFDILEIQRNTLMPNEWFTLFLKAPMRAFKKPPVEKLYIVEADCDRPGEGKFLARFLRPDCVLWTNSKRAHGGNFEVLIKQKKFVSVEDAIAFEYGYFIEYCSGLVVVNGDDTGIISQLHRGTARVVQIKKASVLTEYKVELSGSRFNIKNQEYVFPMLLPEEVFYSIAMVKEVVEYVKLSFDETFSKFILPPGRSSLFQGIKNTRIIDSCYNADLSSMIAVISMFAQYPLDKKWLVIGDILEQGEGSAKEHTALAQEIFNYSFSRIILLGPRVKKYTYPKLIDRFHDTIPVAVFEQPNDVLVFIKNHLEGSEVILFKGARFMEGIIEQLLEDPNDSKLLARREKVWEIRRKQWGFEK